METAQPFLILTNEDEYAAALKAVEQALESSEDTPDDPMKPLIAMLATSIARYESKDTERVAFKARSRSIPIHIALLRTLMDQYNLTVSDLPEIGDETEVSKVLHGQHDLSRQAIEALSDRFGLHPAMFFESEDSEWHQLIEQRLSEKDKAVEVALKDL